MKRVKRKFLIIIFILIITLTFCSCGEKYAESFEAVQVENGYNNFHSGGNMAFINNSLYLIYNFKDLANIGTFVFNDKEAKSFLNKKYKWARDVPRMYQVNNTLFSIDFDSEKILEYDLKTKKFKKSNIIKEKVLEGKAFLSDSLFVYASDYDYYITVKKKDGEDCKLDTIASEFYVYNEKIYFLNENNALYFYDTNKNDGKCQYLSDLLYDNDLITVCDDYCYFKNTGDSYYTDEGIFRYNLKTKEISKVCEQDIVSYNSLKDTFYFSTEDGIYKDDGSKCEKISKMQADELYILDDYWLYFINYDKSNVHRISRDGKCLEKVI